MTSRTRRYNVRPPDDVVRAAAADGIAAGELLSGDDAGRRAGYQGGEPAKSLAKARREGRISGYTSSSDQSSRYWYSAAALDEYRRDRFRDEAPAERTDSPAPWEATDPGGPVPRMEHELELELVRVRTELEAVTRDRDRLAGELERAKAAARGLAELVSDTLAT
jgi:hypothetical protein